MDLKIYPDGIDYLITGVGTGGHIPVCAEVLKKKFPKLKVFAVEPELSPVLSGGAPGPHPLQGIGAGFVPSILKTDLLDGIIKVSKDDAFEFTRRAAKRRRPVRWNICRASLAAVNQKLSEMPKGAKY